MNARVMYALALLLDVIGAAAVLLIATRDWQTIVTPRSAQFLDDTLEVSGRSVDSSPTALALVALAGAVAVIATHGIARQIVGAAVALAGVGVVWRAIDASSALSASRARDLVQSKHPSAASATAVPHVSTHGVWAVLTVIAAVLVICAGMLIAVRGARWTSMSMRYESPAEQADPDALAMRQARAQAALWTALDRGDDPTDSDPRDTE